MVYRTLGDLSNLVRKNISKIPHDIDLVVGIPRSGMLPAMMIALLLDRKVTDLESFVQGHIYSAGRSEATIPQTKFNRVLIVDDSVHSGRSIEKAKSQLSVLTDKYDFIFLAPIVTSGGKEMVDISFETIDDMRLFEWNLFKHDMLANSGMDIDGVLNVDPAVDDDGPIYADYLKNATPLFIPSFPVDTLISCRLEKYRDITEQWLKEHGVKYKHLVMLDMPNKAARIAWGKHGEYKADYYKTHSQQLFIESDYNQAQKIANIARKPVLCIETNELLQYKPKASLFKRIKRKLRKKWPKQYESLRKMIQ